MDLFSKNLLFSIQVTANVLILIYGANFETKEPGNPVKSSNERKWFLAGRKLHNFKSVDSNSMTNLADAVNYTAFYTDYLRHILKERVPGTKGHHEVKTFIIQKLESFGWSVTLDEFVSPTPIGNKNFTNIIATYFPNADRKLALAAHYDSKILPRKNGKGFLGATDAAVSCAMLLDFAKMFADKWSRLNKRNVSPMLIFTDGEEAVVKWSKNDSIYGSRHLARVLADQPHHNTTLARHGITSLDSFNAFILFDLIGAKNPQFFDTYKETSQMFLKLKEIERKLKTLGQIERRPTYFRRDFKIRLDDDHLPFLDRGVPILHLISFPYPTVWHKLTDDESALDKKSISELIKIFRQFLLEYFQFI